MTRIVAIPGAAAGCCTAAGADVGSSSFTTGANWGAVATVAACGALTAGDGAAVAVGGGVGVAVGLAVGLGSASLSSGIGVTVGTAGGTVLATGSGLKEMLYTHAKITAPMTTMNAMMAKLGDECRGMS